MSIAVIFNGQGAHYQGMGEDFAESFPEARAVYEKASALTTYPVRQLTTGDFSSLSQTRYAQVAIAATSLAIYESVESQLPAISYMAGLSLGEYSSLMASGMLSFEDGFTLLKERGELMATHCEALRETADITMAAVIQMPLSEIKAVIAEVNQPKEQLYLANLNSSTQVTIAGTKEAVAQFKKRARKQGYKKIMPLKVEGPFHSPYMEPICEPYADILTDISFQDGEVPVISNTVVKPHTPAHIKDLLVRHLVEPVRWQETIDYFKDQGVTKLIQIGPGKTLANLLKRETDAPETLVIDTVDDLNELESFLGG